MKYLAIDHGLKRTGIAVSDAGGRMAFARAVLVMTTRERFWAEFLALLNKESPDALVLGLPLRADGSDGLTARQVRNLAKSLLRRTALPLYFMPETLSSYEAESLLRESGRKGRALRMPQDHGAAARILESFLALPEHARIRA